MSGSKHTKKTGTRRRMDLEAVKRNAAQAEKELEAEQAESIGQLAQALGEISEGEGLAHLDSRLAFVERQVERLAARRDETDRGLQGELAIMRARIEDALEAVGATAEHQREALGSLEKRLAGVVAEAERSSGDVVASLRHEIVSKVQATATRLEKLDARVRGEIKAFEEGYEDRSRAFAETITETKESLDDSVAETVQGVEARMDAIEATLREFAESYSNTQEALQSELNAAKNTMAAEVASRLGEVEALSKSTAAALETGLREQKAAWETEVKQQKAERESELQRQGAEREAEARQQKEAWETEVKQQQAAWDTEIERRLTAATARVDELQAVSEAAGSHRREMEGRLSEWGAELRLEGQRLREAVEGRSKTVAEALEIVRRDLLARVQASEEKAAGAAIRLQSLIDQQKREIVTDEEEWSGMLKELSEDMSDVKMRVETLSGRVSSAEARRAAERGSSNASVESATARIEALEQRVKEAVEEMVAKQGTRLEMLASAVAGMSETDVAAEEQLGAVDYLKRRVGDMAERVDEIVVKVNAIGRYVTKPGNASRIQVAAGVPAELDERIVAIERAVASLEEKESGAGAGIAARLEALERAIASLSKSFAPAPPAPVGSGIDLSVRAGERPSKGGSTTILPSKKRLW